MLNCMIDLETLSSSPRAAIIQIGATIFDEETIFTKHKATIDIEDAMKYGEVSASTLKWWLRQSEAARDSAFYGEELLPDRLDLFKWLA